MSVYGSTGASTTSATANATGGFGAEFGQTTGPMFDLGVFGPLASGRNVAGYLSADLQGTFSGNHSQTILPFVMGGYSYIFQAGNAINFGGGAAIAQHRGHALRLEVVDHFVLASSHENEVSLRIGWSWYVPD